MKKFIFLLLLVLQLACDTSGSECAQPEGVGFRCYNCSYKIVDVYDLTGTPQLNDTVICDILDEWKLYNTVIAPDSTKRHILRGYDVTATGGYYLLCDQPFKDFTKNQN